MKIFTILFLTILTISAFGQSVDITDCNEGKYFAEGADAPCDIEEETISVLPYAIKIGTYERFVNGDVDVFCIPIQSVNHYYMRKMYNSYREASDDIKKVREKYCDPFVTRWPITNVVVFVKK